MTAYCEYTKHRWICTFKKPNLEYIRYLKSAFSSPNYIKHKFPMCSPEHIHAHAGYRREAIRHWPGTPNSAVCKGKENQKAGSVYSDTVWKGYVLQKAWFANIWTADKSCFMCACYGEDLIQISNTFRNYQCNEMHL